MRFMLLLLAFVLVPLAELAVIGEVADLIAWGPTLLLLVADSIAGAWLVRREGARAWRQLQEAIGAGRIPGDELLGGALLLFGGALLLTPGFLTDVLGLCLVIPVTRRPIAALVRRRATPEGWQVAVGGWNASRSDGGPHRGASAGPAGGAASAEGVEVLSVERDEPPQVEGGDEARES